MEPNELGDPTNAAEIASLRAQIAAEEHNIACLDESVQLIADHRGRSLERLYAKRTKLRQLEHVTALLAEARA